MLRHTYASMLYEADVYIKSAQRFLGHVDIEMTLAVYTHLAKFKEDEAISSLNAHLDKMSFGPEITKEQPKKTKKQDDNILSSLCAIMMLDFVIMWYIDI